MRFLSSTLLGAVLLAGVPAVRADVPTGSDPVALVADAGGPLPALPGTDAEARDYAQREAESPEAREFVGGWHGLFGLLVLVALILLIVYLAKEI